MNELFTRIVALHQEKNWLNASMVGKAQKQDGHVAASRRRMQELVTLYRSLSLAEGQMVALAALHLIKTETNEDHLAEIILTRIASFTPGALHGLHLCLLEHQVHGGDGILYRGADAGVRERIFTLLEGEHEDAYLRGELLSALAWIGDRRVQEQFLRWRKSPPTWAASPYLWQPLDKYTCYAGWELTAEGERRELYHAQCYELVPVEYAGKSRDSGVATALAPHEGHCAWCQRELVTLFDLNLRDPRLRFLGMLGERLNIPMCPHCVFLQNAHAVYDIDEYGFPHWSTDNSASPIQNNDAWVPLSLPLRGLTLGSPRRTPFETIGSYWDRGLSQIGGHPEWVPEPAYPQCPCCQKTMTFVGQFEPDDVLSLPPTEGMVYGFLCTHCRKVTTEFQYM